MTDTAPSTARPPDSPPPRGIGKVIVASVVGTSLEWYDFFLYTTAAALVFNKLFFPGFEPAVGTLLAFATNAVAFVARPVGGFVAGHYGDLVGRKNVLVVTLLLMGAATFLIGCLPTYAAWGVAAPIALVVLRFLQGLGLGGEWAGAVLMSLEHGDKDRRGFNASWPQIGVPVGNLLAAAVLGLLNGILSEEAFFSWGWRIAFFASGILILVGMWIRLTVAESPVFAEKSEKSEDSGAKPKMPLVEVFKKHPRGLLVSMASRIGTDVAFYVFVLFILTYVTTELGLPRSLGLNAVLIGSAAQLFLIPWFGALSDRFGRRPVYMGGAIAAGVWAFAFFPLLDTRSTLIIVLTTIVALATHAAMFGPQASFIAELFSTELRYSGASIGYQIAGVLGGALAPIIAIALLDALGSWAVSLYVALVLVLTVVSLVFAPETARKDLEDDAPDVVTTTKEAPVVTS